MSSYSKDDKSETQADTSPLPLFIQGSKLAKDERYSDTLDKLLNLTGDDWRPFIISNDEILDPRLFAIPSPLSLAPQFYEFYQQELEKYRKLDARLPELIEQFVYLQHAQDYEGAETPLDSIIKDAHFVFASLDAFGSIANFPDFLLRQILNAVSRECSTPIEFAEEVKQWASEARRYARVLNWTDADIRDFGREMAAKFSEHCLCEDMTLENLRLPFSIKPPKKRRHLAQPKWFTKQVRKGIGQATESIALKLKIIGSNKQNYSYCSNYAKNRRQQQQERNERFLESTQIVSRDGSNIAVPLKDVAMNAEKKKAELFVRISAMQKMARENGMTYSFITLTAPGEFHPNPKFKNNWKGWNGSTPEQTHEWLIERWNLIRALLSKQGLTSPVFFRTVEPHKDGTPHWHIVLLHHADQTSDIYDAVSQHFHVSTQLTVNPKTYGQTGFSKAANKTIKIPYFIHTNETGDKDASYSDATIALGEEFDGDLEQAMVSYAMKYVVKGIEGDSRIDAWFGVWRSIRQFQFGGLPSIQAWRELRREDIDALTKKILRTTDKSVRDDLIAYHEFVAAAQSSDFFKYWQLQGGIEQKKKERAVRPLYKEEVNEFEELVKRIKGILFREKEIITRKINWVMERIKKRDDGTFLNNNLVSVSPNTPRGERSTGDKNSLNFQRLISNPIAAPPILDLTSAS